MNISESWEWADSLGVYPRRRPSVSRLMLTGLLIFAMTLMSFSQEAPPVLNPLTAGGVTISGKALPSSVPISIYDISYPKRMRIGLVSKTAADGTFSSLVRPALAKGHQIVAIDGNGRPSVPVTVTAAQ